MSSPPPSTWTRFLEGGPTRLDLLPEEILVDEIFTYLSIRDIMRIRKVNKLFSMLSKKPVVWKRFIPFLPNIQQPLAPLPPTKQYNLKNMSGHDIEMIVSRAVSYDNAWKKRYIVPCGWTHSLAHHQIEDMVLLPGGHFLVTSVHMSYGAYHLVIWSLDHPANQRPVPLIFRETEVKAYALVAKYMTIGGEKGICTSFLRKKHKESDDTRDIPENFEMGGKADEEDPYMPIKYECTTLFVSLSAIEELTYREIPAGTDDFGGSVKRVARALDGGTLWHVVSRIRTGSQLGVVTLDVINGDPHVCVLKRPNSIVFERLDGSKLRGDAGDGTAQTAPKVNPQIRTGAHNPERSVLTCRPIPMHETAAHHLWNFRVLPDTNQVFVFRRIDKTPEMEGDRYHAELYNIPPRGSLREDDFENGLLFKEFDVSNVQISDVQRHLPLEGDESVTPSLFAKSPPPPLSLYLRTPEGMGCIAFLPKKIELPPSPVTSNRSSQGKKAPKLERTRYMYDLTHNWEDFYASTLVDKPKEDERGEDDFGEDDEDEDEDEDKVNPEKVHQMMRVLPGSQRAVIYEIPHGYRSLEPPIKVLYGFQNVSMETESNLGVAHADEAEVEQALLGAPPTKTPLTHPSIEFPVRKPRRKTNLAYIELPDDVQKQTEGGVTALCFDEDTGRLVFATKKDLKLWIVDFSFIRAKDDDDFDLEWNLDVDIDMEDTWMFE